MAHWPDVDFRNAESADDAALRGLDRATWSTQVSPGTKASADAPFFSDRCAPGDVLVATGDGVILGFAILRQSADMPSHTHVVQINGFAVSPAAQGHGIGRRLLDFTQHEALRRGASKVSLRVLGGNAGARHLYESCGFTVEGILRGEFKVDGHLVDDILMAWLPDR